MPRRDTAEAAEPFFGDKLYHERARQALPLLVRQAHAQQKIYYSSLAEELGMPNPRNLNYVLGSIGQALIRLAEDWGEEVPAIQCLVVNQANQLPGEGIGWFIDKNDFKNLTTKQKRTIVDAHLQRIYTYPYWNEVAVLEAYLASTGRPQNVRVILYLDADFPSALIPLRNVLGVEVVTHKNNNR